MKPIRSAILTVVLLLAACKHDMPSATVVVIDTSLSITPRAERAAFSALSDQISHLGRGDSLVLIPITGNAENDAGGRILRLHAPVVREPYDADIRRFREDGRKQFATWVATVGADPGRTDILGAFDAARQELAALPKGNNPRLIVISDFLEDDGAYNFVRDTALANPTRARHLASRLRVERGFSLTGISLCLGRLESSDFAPLSEERKAAVQAFWTTYTAQPGQTSELGFDGTGMLADAGHGCFGGTR